MNTIHYWDATTESMVYHTGELLRSSAGYSAGPEYRVLYQLNDGRYLSGVRHQDRGDLMTDVCYARSERAAVKGGRRSAEED